MSAHDLARHSDEPNSDEPSAPSRSLTRASVIPISQPLGDSERMFVALHRHTATNVIRVIALEGVLLPSEVKRALQLSTARHPAMRVRIVDDEAAPRFEHGETKAVHVRTVARRDDGHWRDELERLLNTPISYDGGPLFQVHYLRGAGGGRSELIVVGEHAVCDGVSMNQLCAELLALCARKSPRPARPRLPVLDALLPPVSPWLRARRLSRSLSRLARVSIPRALLERRRAAQSSAYACFSLSEAETRDLLVNARRAATTLTGVAMAAVMQALRALHPHTPRLSLNVPVNLRPRLPAHGLTPEDLANLTSAVCLESEGGGDLWELARELRRQLDHEVEHTLLQSVRLTYRAGRAFIRPGRPPLVHAVLSNSGVVPIERDYGPFRVRGFFSATSAPMISADLCVFCNTLHDQLTVNVVFPPEIMDREQVERAMAHVRRLLTRR